MPDRLQDDVLLNTTDDFFDLCSLHESNCLGILSMTLDHGRSMKGMFQNSL